MSVRRILVSLIFTKHFFQKFFAYSLLGILFFLFKNFLDIFFLTFIFGYLFFSLGTYIKSYVDYGIDTFFPPYTHSILKKIFHEYCIIFVLYIFFIGFFVYSIIDLPPKLLYELKNFPEDIPILSQYVQDIIGKLENLKNINYQLGQDLSTIVTEKNIELALKIFEKIKAFGSFFIKIFLALILSYVFIIDKKTLKNYLQAIRTSHFGFLYTEYSIFIEKIVKTFGIAFKAQSIIAGVNTILTAIGLNVISFLYSGQSFPFIYTISLIVFVCSFIPVLGVIISSIPPIIIGLTFFGSILIPLQIIVLVIIIHTIEAYYLNPKIVSSLIHLPISLTFVVLIISEHFFGFIGIMFGVGFFYFMLDLLKDINVFIDKKIALYQKLQKEK